MGCVPAWSNPSSWTLAEDKLYAALVADAEDNIQAEQVATGVAEIPLTEDERAAVEEGASAVDQLLGQLVDVPAPAGPRRAN